MSVQSEIDRINANIASAYTAVDEMGGTLPAAQNSANLAGAVSSIPVGVTEERLEEALAAKQDAITGQPGQVVGFDATGAAAAVRGWSNQNLLGNWYLADPVNQRGLSQYTGSGFGIDLWQSTGNMTVSLEDGWVKVYNPDSVMRYYVHPCELSLLENLHGQRVTQSMLYRCNSYGCYLYTGYSTRFGFYTMTSVYLKSTNAADVAESSFVDYFNANAQRFCVCSIGISPNATVYIKAVKLELGAEQTLARKEGDTWVLNDPPPDKALELAKCQRYYEVVKNVGPLISGTQTGYWRYWVPFKAQKRSKPTVDIKSAAGTSGNISYNSGGAWVEFPIKSATPFTDGLILELKEAPVGVASIFNVIADSNM